jgi:glycosyltransferase involved in cell wall biosynthesis
MKRLIMNEMFSRVQDVKVSVCIVTYNQKKYIRECIESLINQETNFRYEIIVGDDSSTDGTSEVVADYAARYPSLIVPVLHADNQGPWRNYISVHKLARGKYICHVDGDDLALPGKLQKASDVLDQEEDVNIVFHRMRYRFLNKSIDIDDLLDSPMVGGGYFSRADILAIGSIACHSSKMYRSESLDIEGLPERFLDYFLDVDQVGDGKAFICKEILGVYRVGIGVSSGGWETKEIYLSHLKYFLNIYPNFRHEISANLLTILLVDIKNRRITWKVAWGLWLSCASFRGVLLFFKYLSFRFVMRVP